MLWTPKKKRLLLRPYSPQFVSSIEIIRRLGLTGNLRLCLDAGDALSAPASPTKWQDLSGNGYDWFRGTTAGPEATDPTFNGNVGGLSPNEFWSGDGGDAFAYDTTNESWMQNLHKNNALFTFATWAWNAAAGVNYWSNFGLLTEIGSAVQTRSSGVLRMLIANGSGTAANAAEGVAIVSNNAWHFLAWSVDEASGTGTLQIDDIQESIITTYTSPSASNATSTTSIHANAPNGSRIAQLAAWEGRALVPSEMMALYQATRGRFGI